MFRSTSAGNLQQNGALIRLPVTHQAPAGDSSSSSTNTRSHHHRSALDQKVHPSEGKQVLIDMYDHQVYLPDLKSYCLKFYMGIESLELTFQHSQEGWSFHKISREHNEFTSNHIGLGVVILKPRCIPKNLRTPLDGSSYFSIKDIIAVLYQKYGVAPQINLHRSRQPASLEEINEHTPLLSHATSPLNIPAAKSKVSFTSIARPPSFWKQNMARKPEEVKADIFDRTSAERSANDLIKTFLNDELQRLKNLVICVDGADSKKVLFEKLLKRIQHLSAVRCDPADLIRLIKECAIVAFHKRYPRCDQALYVITFGFFGADSDSWKAWRSIAFLEGSVYQKAHQNTLESAEGRSINLPNEKINSYNEYEVYSFRRA
ncbi:MAG: hypothetical protein P4M14_10565 [Gammaproteobacteria bacterium]|nr:hypothetical protein [Gammaproteobacteria bacterium]